MGPTDAEIEDINFRLGKRGFRRDPIPISCDGCGERALHQYALKQTNLGGRQIEWCYHCGLQRAYTRTSSEERELDASFTLESFLG